MAGSKRRRAAASSKASATASVPSPTTAASSSASKSSSAVYKTLQNLIELSDESKSEETLQAFCDGKCWIDSSPTSKKASSSPNFDTYWIVLATHILNRLIKAGDENFVVMSAFCDLISKILLNDKSKLERASHSASSRSILARATLSTTVASMDCIRNLVHGNVDAFQAAVTSLDRLINLKAETSNDEKSRNVDWIKDLGDDTLQELCNGVPSIAEEDVVVTCLEDAIETTGVGAAAAAVAAATSPSAPPAKRTRTRRKQGAAAAAAAAASTSSSSAPPSSPSSKSTYDVSILHQAFETIMRDSNQRIDGRVTLRRWASMVLIWLCQGQVQIMELVHQLATEAVESCAKATSSSTKKKAAARSQKSRGQQRQQQLLLSIEQVSYSINRLVLIASEAGNHSGLRPPTAGMDQYIRSIAVSQPKKAKFVRADIRDWAVVGVGDILKVHRRCLENLLSSSSRKVVNDGPQMDTPDIASTLSNLCRAAASSVSNSTFSEQGEWTKVLMSIASAKCLQLIAELDEGGALDCTLTKFGLMQLEDCLRTLEQQGGGSAGRSYSGMGVGDGDGDDEVRRLERLFNLQEPLPDPPVPSTSSNEEHSATQRRQCTFGGMIEPPSSSSSRSMFDNEQALALALRAMQPCEEPSTSKLVSTLADIVRHVYDTRKPKIDGDEGGAAKVAGKSTTTRRTKRRRVEAPPPAPPPASAASDNDDKWHRITSPRALVANEALSALRQCLTTSSASILRRSIRRSLTADHIEGLVGLSESLDKIILKTRAEPIGLEAPETEAPPSSSDIAFFTSSSGSTSNDAYDYTHFEKVMWAGHMAMCQALGRGKTSFDGNLMSTPLIPHANRKKIYKAVAGSHKTNIGLEWPLSLPAGYHAFLVANLTCEPISSDAYDAELYIATECVKSIRHVLMNLQLLRRKKVKADELFLDDDIPFSHRDARTFMLAVSRLAPIRQRKCLDDLVRASFEAVMNMQHGEERANFLNNEEASGFLARVLVVCTALIDMINHGSSLREAFFSSAGPVPLPLPALTSTSEWYRCDRCFMGLFADWESPAVPELNRPSSGVISVKESTINELQVVLETAFDLGFESARNDHCHLLFVAWNGLGKIHPKLRRTLSLSGPNFPTFSASGTNIAKQMLQIRDDVCSIHKDLSEGAERSMSNSRLKINLSQMLKRGKAALDSMLSEHVSTDDEMPQDMPIALFSMLSALPSYISSSIAAHTKPGNDYFTTTLSKNGNRRPKRQRGYSSGSEQHSDESVETDGGGYDSDVRVDVLSRLRECCDAFGAAPIHPDFLDVSCSLREGFNANDAIENAECAMSTLNKLVSVAFHQFKLHYLDAIKAYHKPEASLNDRINLCLNLCQFSNHEPAATSTLGQGPYPDDREWKDDIVHVCSLNQDVMDLVLDDAAICNVEQARESWCPNAAQRLVGKLQDRNRLIGGWESSVSELRAGGEWELLLSEALTIPCLGVKEISTEDSEDKTEWDDETLKSGREALRMAFLWRSVLLNATSHFPPAAALLRLGLNNKVGRKPHPFSFHANNHDPYDVAPLSFSERLSGTIAVSSHKKAAVYETLTLLSRLASEGDDTLTTTCHAISAHLVVDTGSFSDLEGLQNIRFAFMGLKRIRQLLSKSKRRGIASDVVPFVVERLVAVIEDCGRSPKNKTSPVVESSEEFQRLLAFFGGDPDIRRLDCTVANSVEVFDILTAKPIEELGQEDFETYVWTDKTGQAQAVTELVSALSTNVLKANDRTRSCLALLLSRLSLADAPKIGSAPIIVPAIINSFNSIDAKSLKNLVLRDLCRVKQPSKQGLLPESPVNLRPDLSNVLEFLLATRGDGAKFRRSSVILDILMDSFDTWSKLDYRDREPVLDVLFLYGSRFNRLHEIGNKLLARATSPDENDTDDIKSVSKFFGFIRALSDALKTSRASKDTKLLRSIESTLRNHEGTTNADRVCSFAKKSGFKPQHWYNCYTCGLVWDKGCCTLCALVCHKGHDVSYSRFSSFFCDCGAEDGNVTEQTRVSCKCLTPLPADQVDEVFKNEETEKPSAGNESNEENGPDASTREKDDAPNLIGVEIARDCFREEALESIKGFGGEDTKESPWLDSLITILRQQFQVWKSAQSRSLGFLLKPIANADDNRAVLRIPHNILRKNLRSRKAKVLDLLQVSDKSLIPVRAAKGFQVKMSSDTASNALLSGQLSRHEITRSVIAADSRGRFVIAEPCSLVFCSALPAVSVRYVNRPYESPLSRHQMCILGTSSIKFQIVGLKTCPFNERHLVVWGKSEACVAVIKANWTGVEESIDLVFDLDSSDGEGSDHLVKCEWIPGSQFQLAIGCSRFVRIYDITKRDSEKRALPVIGYNLGFEASLRDVILVPYKENGDSDEAPRPGTVSKMFLLLENGRLHVVDLKTAPGGRLESPGDQHFEPSECIQLSTAGVRPRTGSSIGSAGASTRTLGEGSKLAYLKQSRVLLYKCVSSCVLALMLDSKGEVEGTFELIPHTISSEVLSNGPDGYSISGPFTNWTELGVVYREGGGSFFRVACVGKSSKGNKPKLLCIEFNEIDVRIKEVSWLSGSSLGLGLSLSMSFEGVTAFSAPYVDRNPISRVFGERVFMCAATSNGSLLFFGDESVDTVSSPSEKTSANKSLRPVNIVNVSRFSGTQPKKPSFPLTKFETLKNISESDIVVFGGEGIGSDPADVKSRLSRDSSSSFLCPRREGCTLTISIRPSTSKTSANQKTQSSDSSSVGQQTPPTDPVVAGLRVLVGSTSNYIPSKIHVQGRPVDLTPRVKKWYCLPLTDEEIAMSMRNGFVTVGIGPSFDSSSSIVVDSIEVYAAERKEVEAWLPTEYFQKIPGGQSELYTTSAAQLTPPPNPVDNGNVDSHALILSARALTNLCDLVGSGNNKLMEEGERDFLRQLIQDTALDRDKKVTECVSGLLQSLEPDSRSRKSFYDESILFGCSRALQNSRDIFNDDGMSDGGDETTGSQKWAALRLVVQDCLESASSIARQRPMNYLQSMQNIDSSGSIAVDASKLIIEGLVQETQYEDLIGGSGGIVDLSLTEMAIALNTEAPHSTQFAKFDVIRGLLECDKPLVVESCCDAIASFCRIHGGSERPPNDTPDLFTLLQHARFVAYQCDSCGLCPMKDIRYTLLEDDYDIDLCKDCFRLGQKFAEEQKFNPQVPAVINGKTVGGETKLTCEQMGQLQPVSLQKLDVEQVEVHASSRSPESSPEEDEDLQKALRLSLGEPTGDEMETNDPPTSNSAYEYFVTSLFNSLVDLLSNVLKRERCGQHVGPLIRLLLDLVRNSKQNDSQNDRAKRFSKEVSQGISHILKAASAGKKLPQEKFLVLITCLRSLTNLLVPEADSHFILEGSQLDEHGGDDQQAGKPKEKSSPKFVCETHNIPAVRRRCAKGVHKDRRFYVCGKERGQRCKYFVWADQAETKPEKKPKPRAKSRFNDFIRGFLWNHASASLPLHARLCRLVEDEVLGDDIDCEVSLSIANSSSDKQTDNSTRKSTYGPKEMEKDFAEGVYCSREKLGEIVSSADIVKAALDGSRELRVPAQSSGDRSETLLEASLELLTLVADHQTEGMSRWFSLLCEINISTNKPPSLRSLSKSVLKTLCGGNKTLYHSVSDHFKFSFQLRNLYRNASIALDASLVVKEKARQCSENWSSTTEVDWPSLAVGDLIGTGELISEDSYTQLCSKKLGKVLDELWSVIKNRGESWRRFCGLQSLPDSHRESVAARSELCQPEKHLSASAPIVALFWMASALPGSNQVKLLRLVDFALTNWKERKGAQSKSHDSSSDEEGGHDENEGDVTMTVTSEPSLMPEEILVRGDRKLTIDGIVAFAMTSVYGGRTVELRRVAYHVLVKICDRLSSSDRRVVFQRLIGSPLVHVGLMGKTCVEFLHLLQSLCKSLDSTVSVKDAANYIMRCFVDQMTAVKYDRSNGEWFVLEPGPGVSTTLKRKFDLADCGYCVRPHHFGSKEGVHKSSDKRESSSRAGARSTGGSQTRSSAAASRPQTNRKWHPEQICSFSKSHLDSLKEASGSNEFCSFFTLKHRVVISDITLNINDPRGRYVKTVNIYSSPRPVNDVAELKSSRFAAKWQKCASLSLTRGATRASTSLSHLMVAANLKVEYSDFYERPGGSKKSDGSLLVHCPRCTRVVTNAHGVCGNCGEVAFQCRKCRHINYDRLDAFLCVECGYCASGSFSVDLHCGVASNAIAITNDNDLERATKILDTTSAIHAEVRDSLREKLREANSRKKPGAKTDDSDASPFSPALQRAFLGLNPLPPPGVVQDDGGSYLSKVDKQGSVVKFVARADVSQASRSSSTAERTRSLLRLARQIRSESGSSSNSRRGPSDVIIRHLGRGLAIDNLDEENDLIGLLEGGSVLDSSEPLSRVIASVQSRRRADSSSGRSSGQGRQGTESATTAAAKKNESGKEIFEECQKLHMLMREAERECSEINRRIEVWNRLDSGCLVATQNHVPVTTLNYTPSHCSSCGSSVALQLLLLWSRLFLSDPNGVNVDPDFLIVLLEELPSFNRALLDCKRQVVQEIATRSRDGTKLVLDELRKRLTATNDMASAEILGKILEVEGFEMSEDYAQLAMDILAARRHF